MRILAFTPTYADCLRPATVASVVAQRWAGTLEWEVGRRNPYPPPDVRNVAHQVQVMRWRFLAGSYDALWLVEHDMTCGPNTLQTLYDTDADVVYAPYLLRHGRPVSSAWRYENARNLGESLSLYPAELAQARQAGHAKVSGIGFGCTLMRRHVVQAIEFRGNEHAPDIPFAQDALRLGYTSIARFDVAAGHIHGEVTLTMGDIPDNKVMVTALADVNIGTVDGKGMSLKKGEQYQLDRYDAGELARAGYVELAAPAVPKRTKAKE
jgi:hypothetical protein